MTISERINQLYKKAAEAQDTADAMRQIGDMAAWKSFKNISESYRQEAEELEREAESPA